jgi:hypothetical protein
MASFKVEYLKGASLRWPLALLAIHETRLESFAYYKHELITAVKILVWLKPSYWM